MMCFLLLAASRQCDGVVTKVPFRLRCWSRLMRGHSLGWARCGVEEMDILEI